MNEIDDFASPLGDDAGSVWVNDLFERTRLPGTAEELSSESEVIGAMVRTIAQPPLVSDINAWRRHRLSKTATRTAIVAAAVLVGTSTAAATGNLPDAAQSAVARASSHFGVDIPDPYEERGTDHHDSPAPTTELSITESPATSTVFDDPSAVTALVSEVQPATGATSVTSLNPAPASPESTDAQVGRQSPPETATPGPDVTGPAKQGLCRAWVAHGPNSPANQSTAMKKLQAAADAAGQTVAEFCAEAPGPDSTEVATTPAEVTPTTVVDDQGNKKVKKEPGENEEDRSEQNKKEKDPRGHG